MVEILKLMLGRDSEDEIWSRFVFELVIWTQPLGPLCLWQYLSITCLLIKREWSGVPVTHPQQIGRLPELSDVLCPQCKSCWAFDKLIRTEQYYMRLNRTKMIFMYTMCTTHTCDQLSKKCCVNSKEKLNKFHWTVEDCASDKKCIFVALN